MIFSACQQRDCTTEGGMGGKHLLRSREKETGCSRWNVHETLNNTRSTDTSHCMQGFSGSAEENRLYSVFQKYVD
jgi:hypothetical protein